MTFPGGSVALQAECCNASRCQGQSGWSFPETTKKMMINDGIMFCNRRPTYYCSWRGVTQAMVTCACGQVVGREEISCKISSGRHVQSW